MKIRTLGLVLGMGALATWATSCEQPAIDCRTTRGGFGVKLVLVQGEGECASYVSDVVGLQSYYPKAADSDTVDLTKSLVAIRSGRLGDRVAFAAGCGDPALVEADAPTSVGDFTSVDPDEGNICQAPSFASGGHSKVGEVPATEADPEHPNETCHFGQKAYDMTTEWRNVRIYVSPDAPGNRFQADLTYTENGCTATYKACGLWPAVDCRVYDDDPDGPFPVPDPAGGWMTAPQLCDDKPDPDFGLPAGSGINPEFKPVCDKQSGFCVPSSCPFF